MAEHMELTALYTPPLYPVLKSPSHQDQYVQQLRLSSTILLPYSVPSSVTLLRLAHSDRQPPELLPGPYSPVLLKVALYNNDYHFPLGNSLEGLFMPHTFQDLLMFQAT